MSVVADPPPALPPTPPTEEEEGGEEVPLPAPSAGEEPAPAPVGDRVVPERRLIPRPTPRPRVPLHATGPGGADRGRAGDPLHIPAPSALGGRAEFVRAVRPLMALRPSATRTRLNADATAERSAAEGLLAPVFEPVPDRWLNLSLVIDAGASAEVWRPTARDLRTLLEQVTAFHQVRVWHLLPDDPAPRLRRRVRRAGGAARDARPTEVLVRRSRNLVLVVTDCVGEAWRHDVLLRWLDAWNADGVVAVVHLLPAVLWGRTAVGRSAGGVLHSAGGEGFTRRLGWKPDYPAPDPDDTPGWVAAAPVPVIPLDPEAVGELARVLTGRGGASVRGHSFTAGPEADEPDLTTGGAADEIDPVQLFLRTATAPARRLAALLAAAPVVSLPVMRLLAELADTTRYGACRPEHLAEVWLGGLLEADPETAAADDPDDVFYTLSPEARGRLLAGLRDADGEVRRVMDRVTEYANRNLGRLFGLRAAFLDPAGGPAPGELFGEEDAAFVQVSLDLLKRMGDRYGRVAERYERLHRGGGKGSEPPAGDDPAAAEARLAEELTFGYSTADTPVQIPRPLLDQVGELHQLVRRWADAGSKVGTVPMPVDLNPTAAYVDLMFAYALARLGEPRRARELSATARPVLHSQPAESDKGMAGRFLFRAFEYRIEQAAAGQPHAGTLSPALIEELAEIERKSKGVANSPHGMAHFVISRLRQWSRLLEPFERLDLYKKFTTAHEGGVKRALYELEAERDPARLTTRIRELYRQAGPPQAGDAEPAMTDAQFDVLYDALPLSSRVGQEFSAELIRLVPAALKQPFPTKLELHRRKANLFERAVHLAGAFGDRDTAVQLANAFGELVDATPDDAKFEVIRLATGTCVQSLRRFNLQDTLTAMLQRLTAAVLGRGSVLDLKERHLNRPEEWLKALGALLNIAGGWLTLGLADRATPILDEARTNLLTPTGGGRPLLLDTTRVAVDYVAACGRGAFEPGFQRMTELFRRIDPARIINSFTTAPFYSRLHLDVAEAVVFAVLRMLLSAPPPR